MMLALMPVVFASCNTLDLVFPADFVDLLEIGLMELLERFRMVTIGCPGLGCKEKRYTSGALFPREYHGPQMFAYGACRTQSLRTSGDIRFHPEGRHLLADGFHDSRSDCR